MSSSNSPLSLSSLSSPIFLTGLAVGGVAALAWTHVCRYVLPQGKGCSSSSSCCVPTTTSESKQHVMATSSASTIVAGSRFADPIRDIFKEEKLLMTVTEKATQGDPQSVLDVIDNFAWNGPFLMNVGDVKGKILDDAIRARQPKVILELGAYCGYSGTRIARLLPPGGRLISVEKDPLMAAIATKMVEWAGLADRVTILIGTLESRAHYIQTKLGIKSFDLVFLDHHKDFYLSDLQLLERSQLVVSGSVLVADNVIYPGTPAYLDYVRSRPSVYRTVFHPSFLEYTTDKPDGIEISTRL